MLDWAFFDISNAEGTCLIDVNSRGVLIVALTLIILVNDHLRFFLWLILLLFFLTLAWLIIFIRLLLFIWRHFLVVFTYDVQRLDLFYILLAGIIIFICFSYWTGGYTWNHLIVGGLMLGVGWRACAWIMRNNWILLLLLNLLLICFNLTQIQLIHNRLLLRLLLTFNTLILMIFLSLI
jgi:hypothetical protein